VTVDELRALLVNVPPGTEILCVVKMGNEEYAVGFDNGRLESDPDFGECFFFDGTCDELKQDFEEGEEERRKVYEVALEVLSRDAKITEHDLISVANLVDPVEALVRHRRK
jgi:hypothetical protein